MYKPYSKAYINTRKRVNKGKRDFKVEINAEGINWVNDVSEKDTLYNLEELMEMMFRTHHRVEF